MIKQPEFMYEKIAADIAAKIAEGAYATEKLPSERDLSLEYKTNRLTLRKAIALLVEEKVLYKDSTRGTFIGRRRKVVAGHKLVGFVLIGRDRMDPVHSVSVMEMQKKLRKHSSNMLFLSLPESKDLESVIMTPARQGILDGLVITGLVSPVLAREILQLGLPVVLFGHLTQNDPVERMLDRVSPDSRAFARAAIKHLAKKGCRRIALLNGSSYEWFKEVFKGYQEALNECGISYDPILVEHAETDDFSGGRAAAMKLLSRTIPDALFIANERLMAGALKIFEQEHINLSRDIRLMTATSREHARENGNAISYVELDWHEMANIALEMLFSRIADSAIEPRQKFISFKIIEPGV